MIDDKRTEEERATTAGFVVGTDRFMSGWGLAPGRSLFAVPFRDYEEAVKLEAWMRGRGDMLRVRVVGRDYRPRLHEGDHLSIRHMWGDTPPPCQACKGTGEAHA
jgi:hypothetical protein